MDCQTPTSAQGRTAHRGGKICLLRDRQKSPGGSATKSGARTITRWVPAYSLYPSTCCSGLKPAGQPNLELLLHNHHQVALAHLIVERNYVAVDHAYAAE